MKDIIEYLGREVIMTEFDEESAWKRAGATRLAEFNLQDVGVQLMKEEHERGSRSRRALREQMDWIGSEWARAKLQVNELQRQHRSVSRDLDRQMTLAEAQAKALKERHESRSQMALHALEVFIIACMIGSWAFMMAGRKP